MRNSLDSSTLLIVKPDGVGKRVVGRTIDRFEKEGFQLMGLKMLRPPKIQIEKFYESHRRRPFFTPLVEFMLTGPLVAMVWRGSDIVRQVREIIGSTDPRAALPGTLRRNWGTDQRRNLVHASDSEENARREIAFFFSEGELAPYDPEAWEQNPKTNPSREKKLKGALTTLNRVI